MPRLFLAVWPPDDIVEALTAVRRKDQRGVRFVPPENWHVTLRFLGEAHPDAVVAALDGVPLPGARARLGPGIDVLAERALDVLAERALVVPVHGVDDLARVVTARTATLGDPPRRRFVGHLTIARLQRRARMPPALGTFVSDEFDVTDIALVLSRLGREGARYTTIHTWPVG